MDTIPLRNQQLANMGVGQNNWSTGTPTPARNQFMTSPQMLPRYEITHVMGEAGARSMQMAPNSQLFAIDDTKPDRIWLLQTDGAGYLTPRPIKAVFEDIVVQQTIQETLASINERLMRLEEKFNDEQLNTRSGKQRTGRASNAEPAEA